MILNERERRILAEIQRQLAATDPRFARAMRRGTPDSTAWTRVCDVLTLLACLAALLCLTLSLIGSAIVTVLLATATHYLRTRQPPRTATEHRPERRR
jgi:hypothetical protein